MPAGEVDSNDEVPNVFREEAPSSRVGRQVVSVVATAYVDLLVSLLGPDQILVIFGLPLGLDLVKAEASG